MKKFTAILLTVIMVASLFVSCNDSIAPTVTDETVSVSFTEATSRSLTASLEEFKKGDYFWKYAAKKNDADGTGLNSGETEYYDEASALWIKGDTSSDDNKGLGSVAGFSQGIWDFKLFAYKRVGTAAKLAYQGEVTGVSLKKGSANTVTVTVSPVAGDTGTLILADTISLAPAKAGNTPTNLTKVYTVTALGSTAAISPDDNKANEWTLNPGAYKVNVDFVKDGFTYASGSVVATVYSNITTTVSGSLAELVTKAEFDSSINPDVMNKEASSEPVVLGTLTQDGASDVTLMDGENETTSKVVAKVPASAASQIINTVTGGAASAKDTIDLALRVDTVSATNTTLELEIGMQATVTQIDAANKVINQTTQKVTELKDSTGSRVISIVTIQLQTGLQDVMVSHSGISMEDYDSSSNGEGYKYDAGTGILTIKTSSFSPFTVTYDAPVFVAKVGDKYYTSLGGALNDAANGSTVVVLKDITVSSPITVNSGNNITLDLNGMNIVAALSGVSGANSIIDTDNASLTVMDSVGTGKIISDEYGITASNGGTITVESGTFETGYAVLAGNNTTGDMNFIINGGTLTSKKSEAIYMPGQQTLTITGGTINGGISARMGQINISGGTINGMTSGQAADSFEEYWNYSGSAWIGDAIYVWGGTYTSANANGNSCTINITGGTINGNAHRAIAVYDIANKYDQTIAVNIYDNAVVNGTIVEDHSKDQGSKNVTTTWTINDGLFKLDANFNLENGNANDGNKRRNITFIGNGSQTVDVVEKAVSAEGGKLQYHRGSSFTFENLTIKAGEGDFDGIVCNELTFKNCTIKGKLTLYGKATFINCTFDNTMANQYSIWTWGGTDVTFDGCTFNTNGKAILLYGGSSNSYPTNLVVKNCIFNDRNNGAAKKAAIEIGNDYNSTYTLTVNSATVNGFAINPKGESTGTTLWANKNSMDAAHLTVTIDGNQVH